MVSSTQLQGVVLAAGSSSRFKTGKTKLIEKICGQEIILYVVKLLESLAIPTTLVVGYQKELIESLVRRHVPCVQFVVQEKQTGTGSALIATKEYWNSDSLIILNGDIPLVTPETIKSLVEKHIKTGSVLTFVISHNADPSLQGYGRVIEKDGVVTGIVEAKDFTGNPHDYCCVNAGIYLVKREFLNYALERLSSNNESGEFYLTDIVKIAHDSGKKVVTVAAPFDEIRGINTLQELWIAQQIKRSELIRKLMEQGVNFALAQTVHIDNNVTIGSGSYIASGVQLLGNTVIGKGCVIQDFSILENVTLGDNSIIYAHSIIRDSTLAHDVKIGPFAHIHHQATIDEKAVIGNFVEVKKSSIGSDTRAKHLAYLGDAVIGNNVNIGAGTITCNHDGFKKHTTTICDNAYIGSNNTLIAPVTIEQGAFTAAGSTITHNVPENALAFGRARQENKEGYAQKLREVNRAQGEEENKLEETNITTAQTISDTITPESRAPFILSSPASFDKLRMSGECVDGRIEGPSPEFIEEPALSPVEGSKDHPAQ